MADKPLKPPRLIKCDNSRCKRGEGGSVNRFSPSRPWMRFCHPDCRMEAWRAKYRASGEEIIRRIDNLELRIKKLERGR